MGLGFERACMGDIVPVQGRAFLFAQPEIAAFAAARLEAVGRTSVRARIWPGEVPVPPPTGRTLRDTVPSLRLDALVAAGFSLSRAKAAECVARERVQLNHCLVAKGDAPVRAGDLISVRGLGRVRLEAVQGPTKKGRVGVMLFRFGD